MLCIVLLICVAFQFVAIVTPGWNIHYTDSVSIYESVYYSTACVEDECETKSHRDAFYSNYGNAKDESKPAYGNYYKFSGL